jgi:hypothetical protein
MIADWRAQILGWKSLETYKIGLYLSVERLFDHDEGPAELHKLATFLESVGYKTVGDEDIACVWYHRMGKARLAHHYEHGYEHSDYAPGFTKEQQELILRELHNFIYENEDDSKLVEIVKEYEKEIRDHMHIVA